MTLRRFLGPEAFPMVIELYDPDAGPDASPVYTVSIDEPEAGRPVPVTVPVLGYEPRVVIRYADGGVDEAEPGPALTVDALQQSLVDPCGGVCAGEVKARCAERGAEVTVSTAAPMVCNSRAVAFACAHGVTYYAEPTSDQLLAWRERRGG